VTPSVSEIRAQISAILERNADAKIVAMRAVRKGEWPRGIAVHDRMYQLEWCESPIELRLALLKARRAPENGFVLLTPLEDTEIGADVLARLSRAKVFQIHQWAIIRDAFRAKSIDGRLSASGWLADTLIERMPVQGYAPVPTGILDADTALRALLQVTLGIDSARPDVEDLLRWTLRADASVQWASLSDSARQGLVRWLVAVSGEAAELILGVVAAGNWMDAVPLGLIAEILIAEDPPGPELSAAAARAERYTGGRRIDARKAARWSDAAKRVLRELGSEQARSVLSRGDRLLADLYLSHFAAVSSTLPSGLEARLATFADGLQCCLANKDAQSLAELQRLAASVAEHTLAPQSENRVERVEMAVRLARWWCGVKLTATDFQSAVQKYVADGAFVDQARQYLLGGDQLSPLATAFDALANQVRGAREQHNEAFAKALKVWNATRSTTDGIVPVEEILERVVAPLSDAAPVLLLVMDGLSLAVFAELFDDVARLGWDLMRLAEGRWIGSAIAALPTVTEISRASLFCGRLTKGGQQAEKTGFAQHMSLAPRSRTAPKLFHKGELMDGATLAPEVSKALSSAGPRVVGAVYNAIDDQLDGANQLHIEWTLERLRMLSPLLYEARAAGRVVVLTADHGHVLDHDTAQNSATEGGDRWRLHDGASRDGEITFEGGRVLTPTGQTQVTLPWSERLRYGTRKNGYHGGASAQEVLVPLHVLAPSGTSVPGWVPTTLAYPDWWDATSAPVVAEVSLPPRRVATKPSPPKDTPQADWLSANEVPTQTVEQDWTLALIESTTYRTQKSLAARVAPPDDLMRKLLVALGERGGKLSKSALSTRLQLPPSRTSGFISAAQRVLNVDQCAVLAFDERSGAVELNRELLDTQFGLRR
jgi:hypothetical protein